MKVPTVMSALIGATGLWLLLTSSAASGKIFRSARPPKALVRGPGNSAQVAGLLVSSAALAVLGWLAAGAVTDVPVLALVAAGVASAIPPAVRRRSRLRSEMAIRDAWPVAVDELIAFIRSGESLPGAIAAVAEHGPELLRDRFGAVSASYRRHGDFAASIESLVGDTGDLAGKRIASALSLAHRVGGRELIRVLKALGDLIRDDQLLRKEIAARQSWTISGARAAAAAPWVILALFATRSSTLEAFRSPAGNLLIAAGALTTAAGYRAMLFMGRAKAAGGF
ncbi:MAG: type II secretion system protein F [Acidobacteria bacterium]|nr:MAG: type II secretion system protein F [Acidobacteriota bacterium]